jgi:hypothetical protein
MSILDANGDGAIDENDVFELANPSPVSPNSLRGKEWDFPQIAAGALHS